MSKLLITTQYCENYGSPEEPYWKMKGGSDYVVPGLDFDADYEWAQARIERILNTVQDQVTCDNDMCLEYVLGAVVVADDYLTEYERSQLEYDGKIQFPSKVINLPEEVV